MKPPAAPQSSAAQRASGDVGAAPPKRLARGELDDVLGYLLANATICTNRVFDEHVQQALQLRKVEYTLLCLVERNPGVKAGRVARALGFSAPNTSVWIDRLCERGLLRREPDPVDKRALHLHITDAGVRLCRQATAEILQAEEPTLQHLSPAERAMLKELLRKYAAGRAGAAG